ncbi:UvrD-helicase domain-containing protein, partial [Proteus mirabilis]|uniref:UvrD-helicase domain-containing protein n=1 Tax=Proteus mirabilis TaxID=584 RepID=UPI000F27887D
YMLRSNPLILSALRATYSHVFLDEFQDTTSIQYDLLKTSFKNTEVILTAVGDDKQRIMGWAGALQNAFETFQKDFLSNEFTLHMNYRSAPNLVRMQRILSQSITDHHFEPVPSEKWKTEEGMCKIWTFENNSVEAEYI